MAALVGDISISVLLDMIKCFEMVHSEQLLKEAEALHFPMRLAWMLVDLHRQPRRLRAFGS
eukprot:1884339-Pyramimonas_sp.AAC.1